MSRNNGFHSPPEKEIGIESMSQVWNYVRLADGSVVGVLPVPKRAYLLDEKDENGNPCYRMEMSIDMQLMEDDDEED